MCCFFGVICHVYLHMPYGIFYSGNKDIVKFLTYDFPIASSLGFFVCKLITVCFAFASD